MRLVLISLALLLLSAMTTAQKINYEEYDLKNGLHVVLHQDNSAPLVITSVMYHVGSKNENPDRTGFAHFFEHLLFEGTKNIKKGEWFKLVAGHGGRNNANTTDDRTYYYELFPSNNLELALWMESERLMHPVIEQGGVETQNEVVKEEKRLRIDNQPYGNIIKAVKQNMFKVHPYRWTTIGEMQHLDDAKLEEFQTFFKKFYIPNNAVLVVAGQFDVAQAKQWIDKYFSPIASGKKVAPVAFNEPPITQEFKATWEDPNVQIPMLVIGYKTPSMKTREARVLDMISTYLSNGKSSKLYKKMVDEKKLALEVGAINISQEDHSMYVIYGLPMRQVETVKLTSEIDEEIVKLQTTLISDKDLQKLKNIFETNYVQSNANLAGIAETLASSYLLYGDIKLVNTERDIYLSVTKEEIKDAANKFLKKNQRMILDYIPAKN